MLVIPNPAALKIGQLQFADSYVGDQALQAEFGAIEGTHALLVRGF